MKNHNQFNAVGNAVAHLLGQGCWPIHPDDQTFHYEYLRQTAAMIAINVAYATAVEAAMAQAFNSVSAGDSITLAGLPERLQQLAALHCSSRVCLVPNLEPSFAQSAQS